MRKYKLKKLNEDGKEKFKKLNSKFESMTDTDVSRSLDNILECSDNINEEYEIEGKNFVTKKELIKYLKEEINIPLKLLMQPSVMNYITMVYFDLIYKNIKQSRSLNLFLIGGSKKSKLEVDGLREKKVKLQQNFLNNEKIKKLINDNNVIKEKVISLIEKTEEGLNAKNREEDFTLLNEKLCLLLDIKEIDEDIKLLLTDIVNNLSDIWDATRSLGIDRHLILAPLILYQKFGDLVDPLLNYRIHEWPDTFEQSNANSSVRHSKAYFEAINNIYCTEKNNLRMFLPNTSSRNIRGNIRNFNILVNSVSSRYDINSFSDKDLIIKISNNNPQHLDDYINWMQEHNPKNADYLLDIIGN